MYATFMYAFARKTRKNSPKDNKTKIDEKHQAGPEWNEESDVYVANIFKVQTAFIYSPPRFQHAPLVIFNYLGMVMFRWKYLRAAAANSVFLLGLPAGPCSACASLFLRHGCSTYVMSGS